MRVGLAYDGAPFAGFARQPDQVTVQGEVEAALARLFGQPVTSTGAGRTDRGVHALAQVLHLDIDPEVARAARALALEPPALRARLDRMLPPAITVWAVRVVPASFDARFSARRRRYRYRLIDGDLVDPLQRADRWVLGRTVSASAMRAGVSHLLGEHDFASFCRRAAGRTTVRELTRATINRRHRGRVDVVLEGTAFCHQQVRSIVGCLVEVGVGAQPPAWIAEVLAARDRSVAARVAPPHGLVLERVGYGPGVPAAPPREARDALRRG